MVTKAAKQSLENQVKSIVGNRPVVWELTIESDGDYFSVEVPDDVLDEVLEAVLDSPDTRSVQAERVTSIG